MNKNKALLCIGVLLVLLGWFKPNFNSLYTPRPVDVNVVVAPLSPETKAACAKVTDSLLSGPNPKQDGLILASLYSDIAKLISLDGENEVIKTTDELVQANKLSGVLLNLDLKNKYANLSANCQEVIVSVVGEDSVALDKNLRDKAVLAFKNLAWACEQSTK